MSGVTDERADLGGSGGPEDELPPAIADGLRAAARARTAGSTPWPRMHLAVRRARRRRIAGATVLAAALAVGGTFAGSSLGGDDAPAPPAKRTAPPIPQPEPANPRDPDPLNMPGATAGSLAGDRAWIQGVTDRLVSLEVAAPGRIRVLWATDHAGSRHALVLVKPIEANYRLDLLRGPAGATPEEMTIGGMPNDMLGYWKDSGAIGGNALEDGRVPLEAFQIRDDPFESEGPGLIVVVGHDLTAAEAASRMDYDAAGKKVANWGSLTADASVWVRAASDEELDTMTVRVVGPDGKRVRAQGGVTYGDIEAAPTGLPEVALPGTDPNVLTCASMSFAPERGGFPAGSTPLFGASPKAGPEWAGLAVVRAPGGAYLVGLCRTLENGWKSSSGAEMDAGYVLPAPPGGYDDLFAVIPGNRPGASDQRNPGAVYVIAPAGATEVEVNGITAPVRDRLAVVPGVAAGLEGSALRATARDAAGRALGTATGAAEESTTGSFFDEDPSVG